MRLSSNKVIWKEYSSTLKIGAALASEKLVNIYLTAWRRITENNNIHINESSGFVRRGEIFNQLKVCRTFDYSASCN
jgi:hypothetical protein